MLRILDEYEINCKTIIDLGNIRDFTYYTGITFEIISSGGIFSPMVIGGRYDNLVQKYGYPTPATGFAIDIEQVLSVTRTHGRSACSLHSDPAKQKTTSQGNTYYPVVEV